MMSAPGPIDEDDVEMTREEAAERQRRTVQGAIASVMSLMPAIGKDSTAPAAMGGYKFRGIEAITTTLQPILGSVGLVIVPQAQTIVIDHAPGQKEMWQDFLVKFDWLIIGPDGSTVTASTYGIGRDHTDKGATKAQTQAYKYLLLDLFCIADAHDDADGADYSGSERDEPREPTVDERDTDALLARLKALPDDRQEAVKTWAHSSDRTLAPSALLDSEWRAEVVGLLDDHDEVTS